MVIKIYVDSETGVNATTNGLTPETPFNTVQYAISRLASIITSSDGDRDAIIQVGVGSTTLNSTILSNIGNLDLDAISFIGTGESTIFYFADALYGTPSNISNLIFAKCTVNISAAISAYYTFRPSYNLEFYNVIFGTTNNRNNGGVMSPTTGYHVKIYNSVKMTNTTGFITTSQGGIVEVYNSIGHFTNGSGTTTDMWDKGGNTLGNTDNYVKVLESGRYPWIEGRMLIKDTNGNHLFFSESAQEWVIIGPDVTPEQWIEFGTAFIGLDMINILRNTNFVGKIVFYKQ